MSAYAKLRADLIAQPAEIDGEKVINIKDPIRGNYFRLREPEYWLISQLDGLTSYEQVAEKFKAKFELNISAAEVLQFVEILEQQYFLDNVRSEQQLSRTSYQHDKKPSLFARMLFIKLKAINPQAILDRLMKLYRPFHSLPGQLFFLLLILFGVVLFIPNAEHFRVDLIGMFHAGSIATIVIALFILITFHEFAHAIICRMYGGEVKEMGFLLLYFQPCCYCDLSDAWMFGEKRKRLAVTWAGPYSELILMALILIVWRITVPGTMINEISRLTIIVIWVTLLFNLNPLIKLDGYYLLSDWLEIPNLRSKSFNYFKFILQKYLLGWPVAMDEKPKREKKIYLLYAFLSVIYSAFIIIYFLYLLSWFLLEKAGPVGLILMVAFLAYSLRMNIWTAAKGLIKHIYYLKDIMKRPLRLAVYLIFSVVIITTLFFIPFPHRVSGEITIHPIADFKLLLNDFGLLEKKFNRGGFQPSGKSSYIQMASQELASLDLLPYVSDGQKVKQGDTLAILVSNQVTREIETEQSTLNKLNNDLALLQSPPKKEEIDEAIAEVNAADATYQQHQRDEQLQKDMLDKNLVSNNDFETAVSKTQIAKAELENKKARLRLLKSPPKPEEEAVILAQIENQKAKLQFLFTQKDAQSIISDIPGTVIMNKRDQEILSIVDERQVEILIPISDFDIELINYDQAIKLKVRSYTNKVFDGRIAHIPMDASEKNGKAFFMVSSVIENDFQLLHQGMTGYAKIEIGETSLINLILRRFSSIIRVEFWSWW